MFKLSALSARIYASTLWLMSFHPVSSRMSTCQMVNTSAHNFSVVHGLALAVHDMSQCTLHRAVFVMSHLHSMQRKSNHISVPSSRQEHHDQLEWLEGSKVHDSPEGSKVHDHLNQSLVDPPISKCRQAFANQQTSITGYYPKKMVPPAILEA